MALSKTHNLLNQAFWSGVGLRDLVIQALSPYGDEGAAASSSRAKIFVWDRSRR